jgi:two-component sensor histidine kinase
MEADMKAATAAASSADAPGAPLPWNEKDRLAALMRYHVLDTPPEPDFDNITRVASLTCKAPIAIVNLIADERQWFKSEIGLGVRETPLDISICAKAILQPDLFVVPDTTKDSRFDCNPLVAGEPYLRFYAGARLDTPEGLPLGTVCVLDFKPRPDGLTAEQAEILRALARQAMTHLELRRALEARDLLSRELSHRVKNVFAIVGGLAALTARGNEGARTFAAEFRQRLQALAQAHEYVLPPLAPAPSLEAHTVQGLLRKLLAPYDHPGENRVTIDGDDAPLGATAATALALIIHEQATNAAKYGALSQETGRIAVSGERLDETYVLIWRERGGPPIAGQPEHRGFGTVMIARSVSGQLGGEILQDWAPEGLTTRLAVPVDALAR